MTSNEGLVFSRITPVSGGIWGSLDEINDTIISLSPSYITRAGLSLEAVKSVKGKGKRTIALHLYLTFKSSKQ